MQIARTVQGSCLCFQQIKFDREDRILLSADYVQLDIKTINNLDFYLIVLYRLHESNINSFNNEILSFRKFIQNKNPVICGDINIDLLKNSR